MEESDTGSLLARIAQGEQAALKACMDKYGGMIWGLARKFSPTPSDAEDATQEVFLHLWKKAGQFDGTRGSEAIFIVTLARRTLIDRFRGRRRQMREVPLHELSDSGNEPAISGDAESCVEAHLAAGALATLPAAQRRIIGLAVVQGLSQSEIASHTGLPLGTVKSAMRRGLILVREKLGIASADDAIGGRS